MFNTFDLCKTWDAMGDSKRHCETDAEKHPFKLSKKRSQWLSEQTFMISNEDVSFSCTNSILK